MTYDNIIKWLAENNIPLVAHEHEPVRTVADVQAYIPQFLDTMVKTIVFRVKNGPLVLAAVPGRARIDYKKLAGVCGVNRRLMSTVSPAEVFEQLGVEIGGVSPLPLVDGVRLIYDASLIDMPVINTGSGRLDITLEFTTAELVAVVQPEVAAISK